MTTGAIRCAKLQLSPPPPSSLAVIKSRRETFWHDTRLPSVPAFHVTQIYIIFTFIFRYEHSNIRCIQLNTNT